MSRKVTPEKLEKLTLMLGQTVAAMRVNEILTCCLLRWAAAHNENPQRFIEEVVEKARKELQRAGEADGSTATAEATVEALEYLDDLAANIQSRQKRKSSRPDVKGLSLLDRYQFPSFTAAPRRALDGAEVQEGSG